MKHVSVNKFRCGTGRPYRGESAYDGDSKANDGHVEGLSCRETSLLQEVGRVSTESVTIECLNQVDTDGDKCPLEVGALKAGPVRHSRFNFALMFSCHHNQSDGLVKVEVDVSG